MSKTVDLTTCDREPIHVPGSIQPHGVLLVVEQETGIVLQGAGDVAALLGQSGWLGQPLDRLMGDAVAAAASTSASGGLRSVELGQAGRFDVTFNRAGRKLVVEVEPAGDPSRMQSLLPELENAAAEFERAPDLKQLCERAAREFRRLTGYDRVMVYRFLDDDSGVVVAEDQSDVQASFLHHHFPASDIPRQARALYLRNLVRVIPDVDYVPAPLVPPETPDDPLDMSDCSLRSVSPIHIQYLKNMGVAASASFSIVKDGSLWGLVACHNSTPRHIPADIRTACRALAGTLARQVRTREDTDSYRERVRLRTFEDRIVELLVREGSLDSAISNHLGEIMRMLDGDGLAVVRGTEVVSTGRTPGAESVMRLARFIATRRAQTVFSTSELGTVFDLGAEDDPALAAGVLAAILSPSEPWVVIWFRSEKIEIVNWAGNPHKPASVEGSGQLSPRASFEAWSETVRGKSRRWTVAEVEAANRLATTVGQIWQTRRIRDLNKELIASLEQKEMLIQQREFLLGEINHRVQNSLQLVSSFLAMQAREFDEQGRNAIEEARRRIAAVSLVHRRLYSSDQIENIDAARYVDELLGELSSSFGHEWDGQIVSDLDPILIPNDRAIHVGLILTELVINANKYAYRGEAGPVRVSLREDRDRFVLSVEDRGVGRSGERRGFGSRLIEAMLKQVGGTLDYLDAAPGTRAVLTAPIRPV